MKDLAGKTAFITGGGSGVALGQAKAFAAAGMKIVIADIRRDHLDSAVAWFKEKGLPIHGIPLDITDRKAYAAAADEAEKTFGPVQLLCNTAGVSQFGPVQQATYDDWDWQMSVNLGGMINGIQTFIPRMLKHGLGAHIVNTASMAGFLPLPGCAIYCTTKFAVRGLSECLQLDLAPQGIGVSVLCPGAVNTNIHEAVLTRPNHLARWGLRTDDILELLDELAQICTPVAFDYRWRPTGADNDDEMVIETAINGHADALATFNLRDMRDAGARFGFRAERPGPLVRRLRQ